MTPATRLKTLLVIVTVAAIIAVTAVETVSRVDEIGTRPTCRLPILEYLPHLERSPTPRTCLR
jgi:hypothetical protein